jgi:hypothetical protein
VDGNGAKETEPGRADSNGEPPRAHKLEGGKPGLRTFFFREQQAGSGREINSRLERGTVSLPSSLPRGFPARRAIPCPSVSHCAAGPEQQCWASC